MDKIWSNEVQNIQSMKIEHIFFELNKFEK